MCWRRSAVLVDTACPERAEALDVFYRRWEADPLVIDKWFALQARSSLPGTLEAVSSLAQHPASTAATRNRVRALIGAFAQGNQLHFHARNGEGYCLSRRRGHRARQGEPDHRRSAGAASRSVAPLRRGAAGPDARPT